VTDPRQENWFHERQSAWLYRELAAVETDPRRQQLFRALAATAEEQALTWQPASGASPAPAFQPHLRARLIARLLRWFGPRALRPALVAMKLRGMSVYDAAPPSAGHSHAMPTSVAEIGKRHKGIGGGNLRAAVFGANDGLISNASLIMGVAGAGVTQDFVLTSGVAGLLAGALSMAAGEYVSVRSQREMYEYQIALERDELAEYPDEEAEELALIYNARGMELEHARALSHELMRDPTHALDVLTREELGLNPQDLGSPWGAALFSFTAFASGALIPLLPFLVPGPWRVAGHSGIAAAAGLTLVSLFLIGMTISLFTGRSAWRSGLRTAALGTTAGVVTYLIGSLLGTSVG
jgi:VIT1/CCC1 family predicted Fe2+/Mn2+ transporter